MNVVKPDVRARNDVQAQHDIPGRATAGRVGVGDLEEQGVFARGGRESGGALGWPILDADDEGVAFEEEGRNGFTPLHVVPRDM